MYNGIGLVTPRGSGTNGYVQRNWAFVKKHKDNVKYKSEDDIALLEAKLNRMPNMDIIDHDNKRKMELKCAELEDILEEQGLSRDEIDERIADLRRKLAPKKTTKSSGEDIKYDEDGRPLVKGTHAVADAQQAKNQKLREAFGISEYFVEGTSFDPNRRLIEAAAKEKAAKEEELRRARRERQEKERELSGRKYSLVRTPSPERESSSATATDKQQSSSRRRRKRSSRRRDRSRSRSKSRSPRHHRRSTRSRSSSRTTTARDGGHSRGQRDNSRGKSGGDGEAKKKRDSRGSSSSGSDSDHKEVSTKRDEADIGGGKWVEKKRNRRDSSRGGTVTSEEERREKRGRGVKRDDQRDNKICKVEREEKTGSGREGESATDRQKQSGRVGEEREKERGTPQEEQQRHIREDRGGDEAGRSKKKHRKGKDGDEIEIARDGSRKRRKHPNSESSSEFEDDASDELDEENAEGKDRRKKERKRYEDRKGYRYHRRPESAASSSGLRRRADDSPLGKRRNSSAKRRGGYEDDSDLDMMSRAADGRRSRRRESRHGRGRKGDRHGEGRKGGHHPSDGELSDEGSLSHDGDDGPGGDANSFDDDRHRGTKTQQSPETKRRRRQGAGKETDVKRKDRDSGRRLLRPGSASLKHRKRKYSEGDLDSYDDDGSSTSEEELKRLFAIRRSHRSSRKKMRERYPSPYSMRRTVSRQKRDYDSYSTDDDDYTYSDDSEESELRRQLARVKRRRYLRRYAERHRLRRMRGRRARHLQVATTSDYESDFHDGNSQEKRSQRQRRVGRRRYWDDDNPSKDVTLAKVKDDGSVEGSGKTISKRSARPHGSGGESSSDDGKSGTSGYTENRVVKDGSGRRSRTGCDGRQSGTPPPRKTTSRSSEKREGSSKRHQSSRWKTSSSGSSSSSSSSEDDDSSTDGEEKRKTKKKSKTNGSLPRKSELEASGSAAVAVAGGGPAVKACQGGRNSKKSTSGQPQPVNPLKSLLSFPSETSSASTTSSSSSSSSRETSPAPPPPTRIPLRLSPAEKAGPKLKLPVAGSDLSTLRKAVLADDDADVPLNGAAKSSPVLPGQLFSSKLTPSFSTGEPPSVLKPKSPGTLRRGKQTGEESKSGPPRSVFTNQKIILSENSNQIVFSIKSLNNQQTTTAGSLSTKSTTATGTTMSSGMDSSKLVTASKITVPSKPKFNLPPLGIVQMDIAISSPKVPEQETQHAPMLELVKTEPASVPEAVKTQSVSPPEIVINQPASAPESAKVQTDGVPESVQMHPASVPESMEVVKSAPKKMPSLIPISEQLTEPMIVNGDIMGKGESPMLQSPAADHPCSATPTGSETARLPLLSDKVTPLPNIPTESAVENGNAQSDGKDSSRTTSGPDDDVHAQKAIEMEIDSAEKDELLAGMESVGPQEDRPPSTGTVNSSHATGAAADEEQDGGPSDVVELKVEKGNEIIELSDDHSSVQNDSTSKPVPQPVSAISRLLMAGNISLRRPLSSLNSLNDTAALAKPRSPPLRDKILSPRSRSRSLSSSRKRHRRSYSTDDSSSRSRSRSPAPYRRRHHSRSRSRSRSLSYRSRSSSRSPFYFNKRFWRRSTSRDSYDRWSRSRSPWTPPRSSSRLLKRRSPFPFTRSSSRPYGRRSWSNSERYRRRRWSRSRSRSSSRSTVRSSSRSLSRYSRSRSRTRSHSRSRSKSRRSHSRSRSHSRTRTKSRSRSHSKPKKNDNGNHSRSPSIPRHRGSPSFLEKRRITSARKRPIPYVRASPYSITSSEGEEEGDGDRVRCARVSGSVDVEPPDNDEYNNETVIQKPANQRHNASASFRVDSDHHNEEEDSTNADGMKAKRGQPNPRRLTRSSRGRLGLPLHIPHEDDDEKCSDSDDEFRRRELHA